MTEAVIAFLVAGLLVTTRCISGAEARQSVDLQTLVTIAASFGLGKAIDDSGANERIAWIITWITPFWGHEAGPWFAVSMVYLFTMVSSELLTNNAAAALVFPFAIATGTASRGQRTPVRDGRLLCRLGCICDADRVSDAHDGVGAGRV